MTQPNARSHDRPEDELGPTGTRLIADLTRAYQAPAPPPHLDTAVLQAMRTSALERNRPQTRAAWSGWLRLLPAPRRARNAALAAVAAALLLAASGLAGAFHVGGPTFVSAQAVLRHAAARQLAPNQAAHLVETVTETFDGSAATGTADVWFQTDANGTPTVSVQDLTLTRVTGGKFGAAGTAVPNMHSRIIQVGQQVLAYNPEMRGDNTILLASRTQMRTYPSWAVPNEVFDGASVAQSLSALAQDSPQQVRLLPQQTLDGHTVDVVEVDGWTQGPAQRTVFYFDAQSYVLRGFDATGLDPAYPMPSWQVRLSAATTMATSAVPPQTFALAAPATATVSLDLGGPAPSLAATCHFSVAAKALLRSGHSLLSVCQATAPGVTAADLVAVLAAPAKATLDAAVAAGVLTPAQAAVYLGQVQDQLTAWVTARRA